SSMSSYLDYRSENYFDISPIGPLLGVTFPEVPSFPPLEFNVLGAKIFSQELNLTSKQGGPWSWTAGASYRDAKSELNQAFLGLDNTDESKSFAVFGELSRRFFGDRLQWTVGLRYFNDDESTTDNQPPPGVTADHFTASFDSTTPRVVLTWFADQDLTLYTSYSQGFRSGFGQQPVVLQAAPEFPPVKPDKLNNYEIGAKGSLWDRRVSFDAAVYYIKWNDVQQSLTVLYQGASFGAFVNAQSASGVGAEFAVSTQPVEGLVLALDFGWNDLTFDKDVVSADGVLFGQGQRLSRSPEYTAGGSIQYSMPLGGDGYRGKFALSGNYTSAMENGILNGAVVRASDMFISRASFSVEAPAHWSAMAYVDNLNGYDRSPFPEFPGLDEWNDRIRPRTFGLQVDYHLK
ncbi:MAG: TonB-dependent receptor, partial [Gammaproteobacteria bacterium]